MAASPAPSDEPAITVCDQSGSLPVESRNCAQPSSRYVDARYTSSLLRRFSMLLARSTLTVVDSSLPSRISRRASRAQFGAEGDGSTVFPQPGGLALVAAAIGASLR